MLGSRSTLRYEPGPTTDGVLYATCDVVCRAAREVIAILLTSQDENAEQSKTVRVS